jgi:hypothetical protein
MLHSTKTRFVRGRAYVLVPAVAATMSVAGIGGAAASAQHALTATHIVGFTTTTTAVQVGGARYDGVQVSPAAARAVRVEFRRSGATSFRTAVTGTTSAAGRFTAQLQPPAAGSWQFRLVVPATGSAARAVTAARTVHAAGKAAATTIAGFNAGLTRVGVGTRTADAVVVSPHAARRVVTEAKAPGARTFRALSTRMSAASGAFTANYRPTSLGDWQFRIEVLPDATHASVLSPARTLRSADITPPAAVTEFAADNIHATSIQLKWKNPTTADFAGVQVRRVQGNVAPATAHDGVLVGNIAKPGAVVTDTNLLPSTQYAYSAFAFDSASPKNFAGPVSVVATTGLPPDVTPPGPVSNVSATALSATSIGLTWTDPADADLAGVLICRAQGAVAPTGCNQADASFIDEAVPGAQAFTDNGLLTNTPYSYTLVAIDQADNHATDVTASATTLQITVAVLSLNNSIGNSAKASISGIGFNWDVSASSAATGQNLVSGTLDYGDGTIDTFSGDPTLWAPVHDYATAGPFTATWTVTDDATPANTDTTTLNVTVFPAMTATISPAAGVVLVGTKIDFNITTDTPANTTITDFEILAEVDGVTDWDVLDPGSPGATFTSPVFNSTGLHTITFDVFNDANGFASGTTTVNVVPDSNAPVGTVQLTTVDSAPALDINVTKVVDGQEGTPYDIAPGDNLCLRDDNLDVTDLPFTADASGRIRAEIVVGSSSFYSLCVQDATSGRHFFPDVFVGASPDITAPAPVTGLQATPGADGVTVSWTNPADADFGGAIVLRSDGSTGGAAPYVDSWLVSPVLTPDNTMLDQNLPAGTYTYTVFAFDATPNYSTPATVTITVP